MRIPLHSARLGAAAAALALALTAGCRTGLVAAIPEPYPETLSWADGAGAPAVERGFLGLRTRENDSGSLDALSFEPGVVVTRVIEGSPASEAGMRVGDVVLTWDGERVDDPEALEARTAAAAPGAAIELDVRRGDTVFGVPLILRGTGADAAPERAPALERYRIDRTRSRAGWLTGRGGVVLVAATDDAPFPAAGVPVGSVVFGVDGVATLSARGLIRELATKAPGATVAVDCEVAQERSVVDVELLDEKRRVTNVHVPVLLDYAADPDGESTSFVLLDLWLISLLRYERDGEERRWRFLRFFRFSSGVGELR